MRLRNKPQAEPYIKEDKKYYIHNLKDIKDKKVFNNKKPLYVEIGMGKGGFIFENAKQNKDINYIGLELYPTILYVALKKYYEQDEELDNLRITELDARDLLETFGPKSVDKILLTFSDPWPKYKHTKRRLVYRDFLKAYKEVLTDNGVIEFKTDQLPLFDFLLDELEETKIFKIVKKTNDLHSINKKVIMTEYEQKFVNKGHKINWIELKK